MATTKKKSTAKTKKVGTAKKSTKTAPATKKPIKKVSAKVTAKQKVTTKKLSSKKVPEKKTSTSDPKVVKLLRWNWAMAALHAVQATVVIILTNATTFPLTTSYLTPDPLFEGTNRAVLTQGTKHLADVRLGYLIAAFFVMSAIAHLSLATWYRRKYFDNLSKGINKARWIEYAFSASTMMVAIAALSGVYDLGSLTMIFSLTAIMNLLGLAMEVYNQNQTTTKWLAYKLGCLAGLVPWLVFGLYIYGATVFGEGKIPTFVYWIYGSIFLFFNSFAWVMYKQYKRQGKWADYYYGETAYMVLSLAAKSALAWQVFAGTLR
jgi:Heliorhodopsin